LLIADPCSCWMFNRIYYCLYSWSELMSQTRSSRSVSTSTLPPRKKPEGSKTLHTCDSTQQDWRRDVVLLPIWYLSTRCRHKNKNYPRDSSIDEKPTKDNGTSNKRWHICLSPRCHIIMWRPYCKGYIQRLFCSSCYHYFKTRRRSRYWICCHGHNNGKWQSFTNSDK